MLWECRHICYDWQWDNDQQTTQHKKINVNEKLNSSEEKNNLLVNTMVKKQTELNTQETEKIERRGRPRKYPVDLIK